MSQTAGEFIIAPWPCEADVAFRLTESPYCNILKAGDVFLIRLQETAEDMDRVLVSLHDAMFPATVRYAEGSPRPVFYPLRGIPFCDKEAEIVGKIVGIIPGTTEKGGEDA